MTGYRRRTQTLSTMLASLAALVAMLALAGPAAAHGDWRDDDAPAGTIASFDADSGRLVIDLADGDSISGLVTSRTWIDDGDERCDHEGRHRRRALRGDRCDDRRLSGDRDHGHNWDDGPSGEESDLVAGAVVEDAILVLKDGRAFYAKVELED